MKDFEYPIFAQKGKHILRKSLPTLMIVGDLKEFKKIILLKFTFDCAH